MAGVNRPRNFEGFREGLTPEEQARSDSFRRNVDRIQRQRADLADMAADEQEDPKLREAARKRLQEINNRYGGFNPGNPTEGLEPDQTDANPPGPQTQLHVQSFPGGRRYTQPNEEHSGWDKMNAGLEDVVTNVDNAPKRRQAIAAFDQGYSGGILRKVAGAASSALGAENEMSDEALAQYAKEAPLPQSTLTAIKGAAGLVPGSLPRLVGGAAGKATTAAIPAIIGREAPTLTGAVVGTAGTAAGSAAQAGTEAVTSGHADEAFGRAKEAATSPWNLLGTVAGAAGGKLAARRATNPDVRFLEERGVEVGPTTPGRGGAMDDPLVQEGITEGRVTEAGRGRTAKAAQEGAASALEARETAASGKRATDVAAMEAAGGGQKAVDITNIYDKATDMLLDRRLTSDVKARIQKEILDDLEQWKVTNAANPKQYKVSMPAAEAQKIKQKLQDMADFTASGKPDTRYAGLAGEAKTAVDKTGYRDPNEAFHAEANDIEQTRRALRIKDEFGKPISPNEERGMANMLMRRGQDTGPSGLDIGTDFKEALNKFPELRRFVEAPELLIRRGRLEFGAAEVGGLLAKFKNTLGRNLTPIEMRLLQPLSETVLNAAPGLPPMIDTVRRAANEKEKRR